MQVIYIHIYLLYCNPTHSFILQLMICLTTAFYFCVVFFLKNQLKNFMVVGMDSYHDSLNKGKSVGAMVASLNNQCTRYFSKTELHPSKDELMRNLNVLFVGGFASFSVIITRGL